MSTDLKDSSTDYPQSILLFNSIISSNISKSNISSIDIYASQAGWCTFGVTKRNKFNIYYEYILMMFF